MTKSRSKPIANIVHADAISYLRSLPEHSMDCLITSPPYHHARVYQTEGVEWESVIYTPMTGLNAITVPEWRGELGAEPTIELYIAHLVAIFREAERVLKPSGNFFLNLGDTYSAGGRGSSEGHRSKLGEKLAFAQALGPHSTLGVAAKNTLGIPWRVAFALQADGWILRMDAVWHKENGMPASVTDRFTKVHEYVFHFVQSTRYYFDLYAISEPLAEATLPRSRRARSEVHKHVNGAPGQTVQAINRPRPNANKQDTVENRNYNGFNARWKNDAHPVQRRQRRSVLTISPVSSAYDFCACGRLYLGHERQFIREKQRDPKSGRMITVMKPCLNCGRDDQYVAHYAAFPRELAEVLMLSGCPPKVCGKCGKPYKRQLETNRAKRSGGGHSPKRAGINEGGIESSELVNNTLPYRIDLGFVPTCSCAAEDAPGTALDIFMGSGTTAMTALALNRNALGCDANPDYVNLSRARLARRLEDPQFRDGVTTWQEDGSLIHENGSGRVIQTALF